MREVNAADIVSGLLAGAPSEVFTVQRVLADGERVNYKVRIKFLRADENFEALKAAQATAKAFGESGEYGDIYREAQAHEVLARALCAVEQHELPDKTKYYPPLCVSAAHLRKAYNEAEMSQFLNCYQVVKAKYSPLETLEKEDAETWIARLSDPLRGPFFLTQLDSLHWPGLIVLLAAMCRDLYQAAGLTLPNLDATSGSPPEVSTSDTGSSTEQLSTSSTDDPELKIPAKPLTLEEAQKLVKKRQKPRDP